MVGAIRGALAHLVNAEDLPLPDADALRYATSLGYSLLDLGTMGLMGSAILATSVLVLRHRVLSRWVGVLGTACSLGVLAAVAVGFGAFATPLVIVWSVGPAVALLRQSPVSPMSSVKAGAPHRGVRTSHHRLAEDRGDDPGPV